MLLIYTSHYISRRCYSRDTDQYSQVTSHDEDVIYTVMFFHKSSSFTSHYIILNPILFMISVIWTFPHSVM